MTRKGILWRGIVSRKAGAGIGVAGVGVAGVVAGAGAGVSTLLTFGTSMCILGRF